MGSTECKFKYIRMDNPDGNSKIFQVATSYGETLGLIDNTIFGISDSSKLGKTTWFLKIPSLALMNAVMNLTRL